MPFANQIFLYLLKIAFGAICEKNVLLFTEGVGHVGMYYIMIKIVFIYLFILIKYAKTVLYDLLMFLVTGNQNKTIKRNRQNNDGIAHIVISI